LKKTKGRGDMILLVIGPKGQLGTNEKGLAAQDGGGKVPGGSINAPQEVSSNGEKDHKKRTFLWQPSKGRGYS